MNLLKRLSLSLYRQLHARKNLWHLRDWRAFRPILGRALCESAVIWPEVLPWKPRSVLDIGAHRGDVARQLAELYHPEFIALVEPLPQMVQLLETQSFAKRQKIFPCALGRMEGRAVLNVLASMPSSSLLQVSPVAELLFHRPMETVGGIEVPVRTLDSIYQECGLQDLDLLKIDVQGYEPEVLAGGMETLRKTRIVVIEVSFFEHYREQKLFGYLYEVLSSLNFAMRGTMGYLYDGNGVPLQCDAVFINRSLLGPPQF
jgi:FkbM family methyltransferase